MQQIILLISLFIIVFVGFLCGKTKLLPLDASKYFNKFLFYIALPVAIFLSIATMDNSSLSKYSYFSIINTLIVLSGYLLVFFLLKLTNLKHEQRGSLIFTSVTSNTVFLGFPLLLAAFGQEHFNLGVLYNIIVVTIGDLFGFLLIILDKKSGNSINIKKYLKDFFINPLIIASIFGLIVFSLNVSIPEILKVSFTNIANTTAGLSLFSVGLFISYNLKIEKPFLSLFSSVIKLLVIPAITYFCAYFLFKMDKIAAETSVIMAAMPTAVFSQVVADIFNLDKKLTSYAVVLSSLLFLITSTFWFWVLQLS